MALLFCDSVRHYSTAARIAEKWSNTAGSVGVDATNGRGGGAALYSGTGSGNWLNSISKTLASSYATLGCGFRFKQATGFSSSTIHGLMGFRDAGTTQVCIAVNSAGNIVAYSGDPTTTLLGTSVNALLADTQYYIEVKATINGSTGTLEVRVNGTSTGWLALTSQDTQVTANATANQVIFGNSRATASGTRYFSDIVIWDTSGSYNNDFLGEVNVDAYRPDGAGTYAQLTPSTGANYTCVDEADPNTTDYVSSGTAGHKDSYAFTDMVGNNPIIKAVVNNLWALKTDSGTVYAQSVAVTGPADSPPTEFAGSNLIPLTTYTCLQNIYEVNPATSAAWIKGEVNSAEFGVQVSTS